MTTSGKLLRSRPRLAYFEIDLDVNPRFNRLKATHGRLKTPAAHGLEDGFIGILAAGDGNCRLFVGRFTG